jgi:hypothetical protein
MRVKPENVSQKPEAGKRKPKPEARSPKPEARSPKPEAKKSLHHGRDEDSDQVKAMRLCNPTRLLLPLHRGANSIACNILPASSYSSIFYGDWRPILTCNSFKTIDLGARSVFFFNPDRTPEVEPENVSQKPESGSRKLETGNRKLKTENSPRRWDRRMRGLP